MSNGTLLFVFDNSDGYRRQEYHHGWCFPMVYLVPLFLTTEGCRIEEYNHFADDSVLRRN